MKGGERRVETRVEKEGVHQRIFFISKTILQILFNIKIIFLNTHFADIFYNLTMTNTQTHIAYIPHTPSVQL